MKAKDYCLSRLWCFSFRAFVGFSSSPACGRQIPALLERQRQTERDRQRERQRETDRERQTERERQTDRQTDRQTEGERERERERDSENSARVLAGWLLLCAKFLDFCTRHALLFCTRYDDMT